MSAVAERVTFPADIWELADARWQALGYRSLSAYITGLIRYDLLVGGPAACERARSMVEIGGEGGRYDLDGAQRAEKSRVEFTSSVF